MGGIKHDDGKMPWELAPWDAIKEVVKILLFGMRKYDARNWEKGIAYSRLFAAAQRHMIAWFQFGEDNDKESGYSHLAHAACDILFILAFVLRGRKDLDDRPKTEQTDEITITVTSTNPISEGFSGNRDREPARYVVKGDGEVDMKNMSEAMD